MSNRKSKHVGETALVPPKKPGESEFPSVDNPFGLWFPEPGDEIATPYPVPNLSDEDFAPNLPGYRRVDTLFVDHSGWGTSGEPAMTKDEFAAYVREQLAAGKRYGYGITDVGQFQLHLGVYEPLPKKRRRGKGRVVLPSDVAKLAKRVSNLKARTVERGASPAEADTAAQILKSAEARLADARKHVDPDVGPELSLKQLRDVLRRRLLRAVKRAHHCEDQSCDISVAAGLGLSLWAAHLLDRAAGCGEVERLYEQLAPTEAELDAEYDELLAVPHVVCEDCGGITWEVDDYRPETCGNCSAAISWGDEEEEEDEEEDEDEVDDSVCARCGARLLATPLYFVDDRPVCSQACAASPREGRAVAAENQLGFDFGKK